MSNRIAALQQAIGNAGADLVVLNPGPSMTYFTGHSFDAHERLFLLFVPAEGEPGAIVPLLEENNWASAVPGVSQVWLWDDKDGPQKAAAAACTPPSGFAKPVMTPSLSSCQKRYDSVSASGTSPRMS